MKPCRSYLIILGAALLATTAGRLVAEPLGTAFTYQGSLSVGGSPGSGNYDLRFTLMDASSGGNVVAGPLTRSGVPVSDGSFGVSLDFGSGVFDGEARWLAIEVRAGGVGAFTLLTPRQLLTPAPHALYAPRAEQASTATSAATAAVASVANAVAANAVGGAGLQDGSVTAGKIANGQVVRSLNALRDNVTLAQGSNLTIAPSGQTLTLSSPADWHLAGNASTSPGAQFLGTTDNQALELKVNGQRAWRLEPRGESPNVVGGHGSNLVDDAAAGATIGGGGGSGTAANKVAASYGTIAGGSGNLIETGAHDAAIGGGQLNRVKANAAYATVPGGQANEAAGAYSLAAGRRAKANHEGAFVWADSTDTDFASAAKNQFLIRAGGGVGIGKNNPATALDVNGTVTATAFSGGGAGLLGLNAANLTSGTVADGRLSGNVARRDQPNTFTGDQIMTGGNVGIGTASPQAKLDVDGALVVRRDRIRLEGPDFIIAHAPRGDGGRALVHEGDGTEERLLLNAYNDFANGTRVDGNLGIGTNPQSRLDVAGEVSINAGTSSGTAAVNVAQFGPGGGVYAESDGVEAPVIARYAPHSPGAITTTAESAAVDALSNSVGAPCGVMGMAHDTDDSNGLDGAGVKGLFYLPMDWNEGSLGTPLYGVCGEQHAGTTDGGGVYGVSAIENGLGVRGEANEGLNACGVYGRSVDGYAGFFQGRVFVQGSLSASQKLFKIDHPLDPENKYLSHASVESSEMKTFYDGVVTTDARGYATVKLPAWFEALNGDFRYQLTVVDEEESEDWVLAKVTQEIADNRFTIRTSAPGTKVCWQVSGVRRDAWAQAHPLAVEEDKPEAERGLYLAPAEYGQPEEKGIDHARKPKAPQPV